MKKNLAILDCEPKIIKNSGKTYMRFKTNEGWMSCFNEDTSKVLSKKVGQTANVEVQTKGNFTNITKVVDEFDESEEIDNAISESEKMINKVQVVKMNANKSADSFPTSMKVSYAKDCFCAICSRISQAEFDGMDDKERLKLMDLSLKAIDVAIEHYS